MISQRMIKVGVCTTVDDKYDTDDEDDRSGLWSYLVKSVWMIVRIMCVPEVWGDFLLTDASPHNIWLTSTPRWHPSGHKQPCLNANPWIKRQYITKYCTMHEPARCKTHATQQVYLREEFVVSLIKPHHCLCAATSTIPGGGGGAGGGMGVVCRAPYPPSYCWL